MKEIIERLFTDAEKEKAKLLVSMAFGIEELTEEKCAECLAFMGLQKSIDMAALATSKTVS